VWELLSIYPTLWFKEIRIFPKNKCTSFWNFAPNSGLRKFYHDISRGNLLSIYLTKVVRDKLDCCQSAKLTIPPSSDSRPLVCHFDRQALSTLHHSSITWVYYRQLMFVAITFDSTLYVVTALCRFIGIN